MADPYTLSNGTLRNRLSIRNAETLARAEEDLTGQRLSMIEEDGPTGPFTFSRLKATHRYIFQDLYAWAGQVRTTELAKRAYVGGPVHRFTSPDQIEGNAKTLFEEVVALSECHDLGLAAFVRRAADLFGRVNELHPFREGNGRAQRAFFEALSRETGQTLAFDVVSRERMIEASVQFGQDEPGMMRRMFDEINDPERIEPLREAIHFLERHEYAWNDRYLATTQAGRTYEGTFVGRSGEHFMFHDGRRILIGQVRDLKSVPESAASVRFRAGAFHTKPQKSKQRRNDQSASGKSRLREAAEVYRAGKDRGTGPER